VSTWAVIVAGGTGERFGALKQFADLAGRPLTDWSLSVARQTCSGVVLVLPPDRLDAGAERWDVDSVVAGGTTRSESVRSGLAAVPFDADIIVIHDAARPLARAALWNSVIDAVAAGADAAIPAGPVTDTIKRVDDEGRLVTLDRSQLVAVQTPQAFQADVIRRVHQAGHHATDDAALVEADGGKVILVEGPLDNLKVTSPIDLIVAAALMEAGR
jgi:2-C-methyl-D-erythritol 4-phosphate cytidylyltransferase